MVLADVLESFRNKCIETCELDPANFLLAPKLEWQACLKKTKVELELLIGLDMLLMVKKVIKGGMCDTRHRYAKANNRYIRDYDPSRESSYLMYWEVNNLYG